MHQVLWKHPRKNKSKKVYLKKNYYQIRRLFYIKLFQQFTRINLLVDYFGEFVPPTKLQNCSVGARGGIELYIRDMENRILGHVRWRREEKLEDCHAEVGCLGHSHLIRQFIILDSYQYGVINWTKAQVMMDRGLSGRNQNCGRGYVSTPNLPHTF